MIKGDPSITKRGLMKGDSIRCGWWEAQRGRQAVGGVSASSCRLRRAVGGEGREGRGGGGGGGVVESACCRKRQLQERASSAHGPYSLAGITAELYHLNHRFDGQGAQRHIALFDLHDELEKRLLPSHSNACRAMLLLLLQSAHDSVLEAII